MPDSGHFRAEIEQVKPWLTVEEQLAVAAVVSGGWITEGSRTEQFGTELNALIGAEYGVFAPNGTTVSERNSSPRTTRSRSPPS